jgi:hypothetical protein
MLMSEDQSPRMLVQQLHKATDPKYAVFMRSQSGQSAKFKVLHSTLESAIETARDHAATTAGHGNADFTYYAIEIKHRVGIERGRMVDEPMD